MAKSDLGFEFGWLKYRDVNVRYGVRRGSGKELPLLIFNGIGASMELLQPFVDALPETEVVVFDVPGAGDSEAPALPWRLSSHARLAAALLDRLGCDAANVLGVSWGGALAQQFARQYPDRCKRLILAATSPGQIMMPGKLSVLLRMSNPRRYWDSDYMRQIAGKIYGGSLRTDKLTMAKHASRLRRPSERGYYYQMLAGVGWSSLCWLHKLRQPTLILQGDDDPIIPNVNAKILAALIPKAKLVMVDCGHLFLLTRARQLAPIIQEFLTVETG